MNAGQGEVADDELDNNELLGDLQQDSDLTRLTEMVRKHYLNYLKKQLQENLLSSELNHKKNGANKEKNAEIYEESIKKAAELLEDKAVKACMIAQFYQRAMVKIISLVRRSTQEKRIITQLEKLILTQEDTKLKTLTKETQTEAGLLISIESIPLPPPSNELDEDNKNDEDYDHDHVNGDKPSMTLDEKIQMFQKHLQKEKCAEVKKKCPLTNNDDYKVSKRNHKHTKRKSYRGHHRPYKEQNHKSKSEAQFSPTASIITKISSPDHGPIIATPKVINVEVSAKQPENNDNDSVAMELARLFSEEKTELDEIFGIDPNEEPDDPQICKILKEIEESVINNDCYEKPLEDNCNTQTLDVIEENPIESLNNSLEPVDVKYNQVVKTSFKNVDLSKSIWPCELFRQRRKLSESLARLIEEDLRWHEVIKWKFALLFGEDSDDEFTPCSPSIELDEVLMGSCIKRISPWVVKHLMKPMKDGLIGNRFLFKKLAKHLARSIIMENQYPDEYHIKNCIENFFCLHQVVTSLEDLADIPSISLM